MSEQQIQNQTLSRRTFLTATALTGVAATDAVTTPQHPLSPSVPDDPRRVAGTPASAYGQRSGFERVGRQTVTEAVSFTPLESLHGIITPSALHFERHHNGVPVIDPTRHQLLIHGLVERPMIFTMDELKRFPAVSRLAFIECSGNSAREWSEPGMETVQRTHGLISTSEWTGVALSTVLAEAGLKPEAAWVLVEGSDGAAMTRSIPLAQALPNAMLCFAQNGEALRPEQGYPLRLMIPGWEGSACVKWVRRLKLGQTPFMTREETARYADLMPDGIARQFTFVMDAKSVITSPSGGQRIQPGFIEIRGLAWSGRGRIAKVEISTDGGRHWHTAPLQEQVLPMCQTCFRFPWRWSGQEAILQSRCVDETVARQPTRQALLKARSRNSLYHYHAIQSWKVSPDGKIQNIHV